MGERPGSEASSQFYSGLVAELYEPLAGETSRADDYVMFLDHAGTPALELACGSGLPMLDLLERGYDVEGLDASNDMLDLCRSRGRERGLDPVVHLAEMQSFDLSRQYRSIFLAGASFTLLTTDEAAACALGRIYAHLEPGGSALIPLETIDVENLKKAVGHHRERFTAEGTRLRVGLGSFEVSADGRNVSQRLRYEKTPTAGHAQVVERNWERRVWTQSQFRTLVVDAGFDDPTFVAPAGGVAEPDAEIYVALLRKPNPGGDQP